MAETHAFDVVVVGCGVAGLSAAVAAREYGARVAVLERAGLITKQKSGREQLVRSNTDAIRTAYGLLEEIEKLWRDRVDRMGEILAEPDKEKT